MADVRSPTDSRPKFILWYYSPSIPAAAVALSIFAILTALHAYRLSTRKRWFCIPLVIGGIFEIIGYSARIWANPNRDQVFPYALQTTAILLAPILFAATGYMLLGRVIGACPGGERHSFIRPAWLTRIFVGGDITSFLIQCSGAGLMTAIKTAEGLKMGENMVLGGLIFQIVIFIVFVAVAIVWHRRMARGEAAEGLTSDVEWRRLLWSLYAFSALILVRNVIRCAEYGLGQGGYLLSHEWITYVFDAIPMAVVLAVSLLWYGLDPAPTRNPARIDQESSGSEEERKSSS